MQPNRFAYGRILNVVLNLLKLVLVEDQSATCKMDVVFSVFSYFASTPGQVFINKLRVITFDNCI